jgi:pimeloyl-ACP methyl ester carboxylesterase
LALKEIVYKNNTFKISYEILNRDKTKDIVFLHGWGSNKELMKQAFGKYFRDFRHIYVDMPGFGKSSNEMVLDTTDYKNIVEKFLKNISLDSYIALGHSFGGKVALLLNPKKLILLSSAGIPVEKSFGIKFKILLFKSFKSIGFGKMYKFFASKDVEGMSQNMYETFKNVVDEDFSNDFKSFSNDALILWGKNDKATPLTSGKNIANLIKKSNFYEFEGDHYFFLKEPTKVAQKIKEFIGE